MVNRFMQTEVVPVVDGHEKRGQFPRELIRKAGEAGLCARGDTLSSKFGWPSGAAHHRALTRVL